MIKAIYIEEPNLVFGYEQRTIDPRDGLVLFGPNQPLQPYSLRVGVIGLKEDINQYNVFVSQLNKPIFSTQTKYKITKSFERSRPSFPGFEAIFNVKWSPKPEVEIKIDLMEIERCLKNPNKIFRTNALVDLYLNKICQVVRKEDAKLDVWFVLIPSKIYNNCNANSWGKGVSIGTQKYAEKVESGVSSPYFSAAGI